MQLIRRFRSLALVAGLVAGCVDGGPTAVGRAPAQVDAATLEEIQHAALVTQRDAIRATQAATAKGLEPVYKLLLTTWKQTAKGSGTAHYLTCMPLPYVGNAEVIGPAGGVLKVGPHTLTVPPGALSKEYVFVGERPMGDLIEVDFGPEGLKFLTSATLRLDYKSCSMLPPATFRAAYVDGAKTLREWQASQDDKVSKVVTASINHFSGYIIAY